MQIYLFGWWQLKYFWNFHPDPWGRFPSNLTGAYFVQMGWFNHQLVMDVYRSFFVFCIDKIYIIIYIYHMYVPCFFYDICIHINRWRGGGFSERALLSFSVFQHQVVSIGGLWPLKQKPHRCTSWNPDRHSSPRKSVEWEKALQLLEILAQKLGFSAAFQWLRMCFWWHLMLSSMMSGFAWLKILK